MHANNPERNTTMTNKKNYCTLELPLIVSEGQKNILDMKMECVRKVYNNMLGSNIKKYNEMTKTKLWRELKSIIHEELQLYNGRKTDRLKDAYNRINSIIRENNFSEYGFKDQAVEYSKYYQKHISSSIAMNSIGIPMWFAFERLLFGNGEKVHFKSANEYMSLASNNKSGIRLRQEDDGRYYVLFSNVKAKAKELKLFVNGPHTAYEDELIQSKIKIVRVIRKIEKGNRHYYCQLIVENNPPLKLNADGTPKHKIGTGIVGIAIWRGILCAVSNTKTLCINLSPNTKEFEIKKAELGREIEHLRRVNNQQNYNEDGTIKKGFIDKDGKRHKLYWRESNHLKALKRELSELYRVHGINKALNQNRAILELLSMGDEFHFADTSFLTMKPEWDEENILSNAAYSKKKERRKAIQEYAPATFLSKLDKKLATRNLPPIHRHQLPDNLYWYQHDKGISDKDLFPGINISVCNTVLSQIMYRAFLIRHFDNAIPNLYDQKSLCEEWDTFICNLRQD